MTDEWVLLVPAGTEVHILEALVPAPQLLPADDPEKVARAIRRIALERELAELNGTDPAPVSTQSPIPATYSASEPPSATDGPRTVDERYRGRFQGADGVWREELHHTARAPGPQYVCTCGQGFYAKAAHAEHITSCMQYAAVARNPQAIPGAYVAGSATQAFDRELQS